jgi:hypothetical protein
MITPRRCCRPRTGPPASRTTGAVPSAHTLISCDLLTEKLIFSCRFERSIQLQRQHDIDEAAANEAIQRSQVEHMHRQQQVTCDLSSARHAVRDRPRSLQDELHQLHELQRGRDRAVAADRYDVAMAAQVCHAP